MRIYMDLCCFNRPFDDQNAPQIYIETEAKLIIQNMIIQGEIELVWSYMLDYENSANPDDAVKETIDRWKKVSVAMTEQTDGILSIANRLKKIGIGTKDAVHVACAAFLKADCFVTVDKGIIERRDRIAEIAILNPIEFVQKLEETR